MSNHLVGSGLKRAFALGIALSVAGCSLDSVFGGNDGKVRMVIAPDGGVLSNIVLDSTASLDRDGDDNGRHLGSLQFQTASVLVSSILVRTEDGELVNLDVSLPMAIDVVELDGGKQVQLPDGVLPADTYDQVVIVITAVQGVTTDGTVITIEPPGGGWTSIIPICPFAVVEGETAPVGIGFNVRNSFLRLGVNNWSFQPRFRSLSALSACESIDED